MSSVYAGIGGVFFAHQNGFINSDTFVFSLSISLLTSVLMGGSGTLFGPLVGSVILNLIPTVFALPACRNISSTSTVASSW